MHIPSFQELVEIDFYLHKNTWCYFNVVFFYQIHWTTTDIRIWYILIISIGFWIARAKFSCYAPGPTLIFFNKVNISVSFNVDIFVWGHITIMMIDMPSRRGGGLLRILGACIGIFVRKTALWIGSFCFKCSNMVLFKISCCFAYSC